MTLRLGDVIDDYCPRCRRVTNHSVAALVGTELARTSCRTCDQQHEYRNGQAPPPKSKAKGSAFDQVLAGILATQTPASNPEPLKQSPRAARAKRAAVPGAAVDRPKKG